MPASPVPRVRDDRCPGVLQLTEAADGGLARVRIPGGFVTGAQLGLLADAAAELGNGRIELTSRGNVQLRGLSRDAGAELEARLVKAGLWPSATHERVRNVVASPLAGLDRDTDLSDVVRALDAALCATPRLAELSGRFLFAVDDGRGDVAGLGPDVLVEHVSVNGLETGGSVEVRIRVALALAEAFLDERASQGTSAWCIADLVDGAARVRAQVAGKLGLRPMQEAAGSTAPTSGPSTGPSIGGFAQLDGSSGLVIAVPLGRIDAEQLRWLGSSVGDRTVRVTPWRSIVVTDAPGGLPEQAAARGFGVEPDSPWPLVSACAGRPGCAKALADVQSDARTAAGRWPGRTVHWSGCDRRCGRPRSTEVDVIATAHGYRLEGAGA